MRQTHAIKHWLSSSWKRSHSAGLNQQTEPEHQCIEKPILQEKREQLGLLIHAVERGAIPLFNQLYSQRDSRLILSDSDGVIIRSWGVRRFQEKLHQIALASGSCWSEKQKGTNAIGTALVEQKAISVIGGEHFIRRHHFISCSAAPIFNHNGKVIGVLDITSEQQQHDLSTQLLVQNMVQLVEDHLLNHIPTGASRFHLACERELLESGWQGVVIADRNGQILATNHIAKQLLNTNELVGRSVEFLYRPANKHLTIDKREIQTKGKQKLSRDQIEVMPLHHGDANLEAIWQRLSKVVDHNIPIVLLGETGAGKTQLVKRLHLASSRRHSPLVSVNCGAIPDNLIESELFGYVNGAFTGASSKGYEGKVRQAHHGILFLDEIADLPLSAQCRLLQVLQEQTVTPIGSNRTYDVDIQVIAATHKDLKELVDLGQFRQDLYYRLNGLVETLPALRHRADFQGVLDAIHSKHKFTAQGISEGARTLLTQYHWPGNLRELDNVVKVAALLHQDAVMLEPEHFSIDVDTQQHLEPSKVKTLQETVEQQLKRLYEETHGNISLMAKQLGVSRNTVYRKLRKIEH